jgi:hypothetical protein
MQILGGMAAFFLIIAGLAGLSRYLTRPAAYPGPGGYARSTRRRRRAGSRQRKSLLVTAAKAAGVKVTSDHLSHALAELTGRGAGATARAGGRLADRGGRTLGRVTGRAAGRLPWRHRRPGAADGQAAAAASTRRADGKPETPADTQFFDLRQAGYNGPVGQDGRPAASGPAADALASLAAATPDGGAPPAPAASPAAPTAPDRARRENTMTRRYSMSLDRPSTDAEFLESCVQLGDVLKGLADEVGDWAEGLAGLHLPPSVLNPLTTLCEGIEGAATGAAEAAASFEEEFEDARDVASRGMHFTGEDAA